MSVIIAVKENGIVYMGADSQTTIGDNYEKENRLNENDFKIHKLENGMLAGLCGKVKSSQRILYDKDILTLDKNGMLTKEHILTHIIPKLLEKIDEIGEREKGNINSSLILAHNDSLYKIDGKLRVKKCTEYAKDGSGSKNVDFPLHYYRNLPIKERIITTLQESARRDLNVSGPFVLIDTKEQKFEIVDSGRKNFWLLQ